jgi:acetyl esterase/lipase
VKRPAIVLFHGGGWAIGEPAWAFPRAKHFAERGMVAVAAQYRLSDQKEVTPHEAMADARAVIRWVRVHADSLHIDPNRVVAYGWSAGAHLAASAAIFGVDEDSISARPDALILVSPAVSLAADGWAQRLLKSRGIARDISPDEHVRKGLPPTLILQGDVDTVTPMAGAKRFCDRMRAAGNVCELHVYEGFGHLFTPAGTPDDGMPQPDQATSADALKRADRFLASLGFLDCTTKRPHPAAIRGFRAAPRCPIHQSRSPARVRIATTTRSQISKRSLPAHRAGDLERTLEGAHTTPPRLLPFDKQFSR